MTKHPKESIPCRVCRLRVFLVAWQLFLDSASLDEEPDLAAERFNHLEEIFIGLDSVVAEQFHYTVDLAAKEERKGEPTVQTRLCRIGSSGKIWIARNVVDPGRFF